jgi:hypothetical protein
MSNVRRTSLAIIAALVLLGACGRGSIHSEPDQDRPALNGVPGIPGDPGATGTPERDTTEIPPGDTTRLGGGSHGSGG